MQLAFWKKKKQDPNKKKKPVWREWLDAALFAIIAATIIRTFFIEAYTIPTPSMEGSMLVNDFLFVSKTAYGPRIPNTPLAFPLVHNTMPITGGKSYSESVHWKYKRLPGFGKVERNDVVVFNFPNGDTVVAEMPDRDYYEICRNAGGREAVRSMYTIITRPVDKKENYIKR
ncbi:MAG: S26 family signal peptidase, partial [Chitinophagaceae bacterium]|nr:S26 family signal peptidase [Chitinophagaceae bacterium]